MKYTAENRQKVREQAKAQAREWRERNRPVFDNMAVQGMFSDGPPYGPVRR